MAMDSAIRAELRVEVPARCQIAAASDEVESVTDVARDAGDGGTVTEEFTARGDSTPEGMETVFAEEGTRIVRFDRPRGQGCVCDLIEECAGPVRQVSLVDGGLVVVFFAPDTGTIREVVDALRDRVGGVSIRRLTRAADDEARDLVLVDREALTDRQREVLVTAHEMGYFDHPRGANAGEVAEALDISTATFTEHLSAAQSKLMRALFSE